MSTRTAVSSDSLLDDVRRYADTEERARVAKLIAVLDWAEANEATHDQALDLTDPFVEPALYLAGPGAPVVPEYAAMDLALSLGMSTNGGLHYLAKALELCHRLPRLYRRVVNHEVPFFKAFRVAEQTISLPEAGAWHVDRHLAPHLHNCAWAQIDRTVEAARDEHDPDEAERRRKAAAENRKAEVYLDSAHDGVVDVNATMDVADAIDLEQALKDGAQQLADLGSTEPLDVRRSQALGEMARQQPTLEFGSGRGVTVYAHFDGLDPDLPGVLDNIQSTLLLAQLKAWCEAVGTKVVIKPVIDLGADISTTSYVPTDAIREVVTLRDRCCVFPGCTRRRVDLDHIVPFDLGGKTCTSNLAMLCRRHHRAKTHGSWSYVMVQPGLYAWTSPSGQTSLVDRRPPHRRQP